MRIGIIGHFGGNEKFNDGQTVKTVAVYDALKRYGVEWVDKIDTYHIKKNPIRFCGVLLKSVLVDKKYIVLLSSNGRKALFPLLSFMGRFLKKEIYHYGIGGRLAIEVSKKPRWKKYVSSFKSNWMESVQIVKQLQELGVRNAIYLPNFKKLDILKESELASVYHAPFRFCTFSRVMAEKGIEDAIQAITNINAKYGKGIAELDIYGPMEQGYGQRLDAALRGSGGCCKYCGVVEATKSVEVLKGYYMLLFPTHWKHEGMPGTIIDALSAGIPVIARRWQYCDEMLGDKVTGYVYDFDKPQKLIDSIAYAVEHCDETMKMKTNCLKKAEEYSEPFVIKQIMKQLRL